MTSGRGRRAVLEEEIKGQRLVLPVRRLSADGLEAWAEVQRRGYEGLLAKEDQEFPFPDFEVDPVHGDVNRPRSWYIFRTPSSTILAMGRPFADVFDLPVPAGLSLGGGHFRLPDRRGAPGGRSRAQHLASLYSHAGGHRER